MEREYYRGDERKVVEVIDDVVALKVPESGEMGTFRAVEALADLDLQDEALDAFQDARWVFVQPSSPSVSSLDDRRAAGEVEDAGKLVRRPNGRLGIVTRRLTVQLGPDVAEADAPRVLEERGLRIVQPLTFAPNLYEVDTEVHEDALAASVDLQGDPRFVLAEPSIVEHVPARFTPGDPRFGEQWQWTAVQAEEAWDHTMGAGIRVAVIDNGFNTEHEDLAAGILGTSGRFEPNGALPARFVPGTAGMPASDHGTFCAGMVAARQGNLAGGCGAAPEASLILIACLNDQVGTQVTLARAVAYAADPSREVAGADPATGADILVSSLGPNGADWDLTRTMELAIEFAAANGRSGHGLCIFWAASNGNNVDVLKDEVVSHDDVIAVVRSTVADLEDNAARGPAVELIAPGATAATGPAPAPASPRRAPRGAPPWPSRSTRP